MIIKEYNFIETPFLIDNNEKIRKAVNKARKDYEKRRRNLNDRSLLSKQAKRNI